MFTFKSNLDKELSTQISTLKKSYDNILKNEFQQINDDKNLKIDKEKINI